MTLSARASVHWVIVLSASVCGACTGVLAIYLFVEVATESGSDAGNILRVGFGLVLLLISGLLLGVLYWKSSRRSSSDRRIEE